MTAATSRAVRATSSTSAGNGTRGKGAARRAVLAPPGGCEDATRAWAMLGAEYDYVHGSALVRITGKVVPSVAEPFQAALASLP